MYALIKASNNCKWNISPPWPGRRLLQFGRWLRPSKAFRYVSCILLCLQPSAPRSCWSRSSLLRQQDNQTSIWRRRPLWRSWLRPGHIRKHFYGSIEMVLYGLVGFAAEIDWMAELMVQSTNRFQLEKPSLQETWLLHECVPMFKWRLAFRLKLNIVIEYFVKQQWMRRKLVRSTTLTILCLTARGFRASAARRHSCCVVYLLLTCMES